MLRCIHCIDIGKFDTPGSHPTGVNAVVSGSPFDQGVEVWKGVLIPAAASCTDKSLFPDTFNAFHNDLLNGIDGDKVSAAGHELVVALFSRKSIVVQKPLGTRFCKNARQLNVAISSPKFGTRKVEIELRECDIMHRPCLAMLLFW